jgi:hypothetical protein
MGLQRGTPAEVAAGEGRIQGSAGLGLRSPAVPETATPRLHVVVPVYLDVESFLILRDRVREAVAALPVGAPEFVVVDDSAGRDPQTDRLAPLADVRLVVPPFNLGHQRAIVYGVRLTAEGLDEHDIVVSMDADGEDRPEDLPQLLAPLLEAPGEYQRIVLARRAKRQEGLPFRLFYLVFVTLFRALTGLVVRTGNYAAYHGWVAQNVLRHPHFDLCYSSTLVSLDLDVVQVGADRGRRYAGQSRMNFSRLVMHALRMLMPFTDRIAIRSVLGFAGALFTGVLLALLVVAVRLFTDEAIPGWATTTVLLLCVLSFIALGNLVVLFVVFSHSRGISLSNLELATPDLEERAHGSP